MDLLKEEGRLFFEFTKAEVMKCVQCYSKGISEIELRKDLSGNERMIRAVKVISDETTRKIVTPEQAYARITRICARKEYAPFDIRQKLLRLNLTDDVVELLLERLIKRDISMSGVIRRVTFAKSFTLTNGVNERLNCTSHKREFHRMWSVMSSLNFPKASYPNHYCRCLKKNERVSLDALNTSGMVS